MKPNVISLANPDATVTRDLAGYDVNLAMSYADECLTRWARARTEKDRARWSAALQPLPIDLPWREDSSEVIEAARSREPYKPEKGYVPDDFDRDLDLAVKGGRLPEGVSFRGIGSSLASELPEATVAILSEEARKASGPLTDGFVLEWILGAATTAWGLARTRLGRGQATLEKGNETITGNGWTIRFEASADFSHVDWWLSWGAGHPANSNAWEGADLEWLAAVAPRDQLKDLVGSISTRRLAWLGAANQKYVRLQLSPLVKQYADTATPHKYRYIALFSKTPEQLKRTPKTAAVISAIGRVTLADLTDRRLPAEIPEGASPASVAKTGCGSILVVAVALSVSPVLFIQIAQVAGCIR